MASRSVLLATCIVARDPRVDASALLDLWARELPVPANTLERSDRDVAAAVLDDLDNQSFLVAAIRGTRAGLAVGCHLGTRVHGGGDDEPAVVSARSVEAARQLAHAAGDGQVLLSNDLGAFLTIARCRLAPNLESTRVRVAAGSDASAFKVRLGPVPPAGLRGGTSAPSTLDEGRRSRLIERLGAALTPFLGPIAPLLVQQLPSGRMGAQELIEAVLRDVPEPQREPVRRVIEDEIRALR
ncbi:MAG TPA: hypothetical protein VLW55_00985 [Burkholderiaceae bacterium]|nr:hypothetical protein [Burkholderiaceae bacterium]